MWFERKKTTHIYIYIYARKRVYAHVCTHEYVSYASMCTDVRASYTM